MLLSYIMWIMLFIGETLRRGGRTCIDYWNQVLGNIVSSTMPSMYPIDPIRSRTERDHPRNRILLLGLIDESTKSVGVPNIDLIWDRILKMELRKASGKDENMKICKLSDFEMHQVISVLDIITSYLINKGETKPIILHTGWSSIDTWFIDEFMEWTIVRLCHPHLMYGIGAYSEATHERTLHY